MSVRDHLFGFEIIEFDSGLTGVILLLGRKEIRDPESGQILAFGSVESGVDLMTYLVQSDVMLESEKAVFTEELQALGLFETAAEFKRRHLELQQ